MMLLFFMSYRKWSIKRRGAYFLFPVIGVVFISTTGKLKHWGEYRENYVKSVLSMQNLV